ncbi:MAG: NAD(P)H-dependent oxidoreductase [Pseudomonadota bacterium]
MPHHYILLANPSPKSFCHSVAWAYAEEVKRAGQSFEIRDLNQIPFDPVLKDESLPARGTPPSPWVEAELDRLAARAAIVMVYPIWFGGPPAILKGYIDRVFGTGCDIGGFQDGKGPRALKGKWLLTITTSAASRDWLAGRGQQRALREGWEVYLERGFAMRDAGHLSIDRIVPNISRAYADEQLERVRQAARETCGRLDADARG